MNIQPNEQTYRPDLQEQLQTTFNREILDVNQDPNKGISFSAYYQAFYEAESQGNPLENAAQLQKVVGGRYLKAQIAYHVLASKQSKTNVATREVPDWFMKPLNEALKLDIHSLWQTVEQDIASIVGSRVKVAEHQSETFKQRVFESSVLIEELQDQLAEFQPVKSKLEKSNEENKQLQLALESLNAELAELRKVADESLSQQSEVSVMKADAIRLRDENDRLRSDFQSLNDHFHQVTIEKAVLEGRLLEREQRANNDKEGEGDNRQA